MENVPGHFKMLILGTFDMFEKHVLVFTVFLTIVLDLVL